MPMMTPMMTYSVAFVFMQNVFKIHEIPFEMMCNRDPKFWINFATKLFKMFEIKIGLSTAYHLEIGGQIEWTNRSSKDILWIYVGKRQQSWDKSLCLYEFAYNQRLYIAILVVVHSFALYEQDCKTSMTISTPNSRFESVKMVQERNEVVESIKMEAWGVVKIEPYTMRVTKEVSKNLRWANFIFYDHTLEIHVDIGKVKECVSHILWSIQYC